MKERYIATVDLGTGKLALSVARVLEEDVEVLYYRERPSDGMRYGRIFNPLLASVPLTEAVKEAEEELGIKIRQVVIGLPRYGVRQETASASIERSDPSTCISQEEIDAIKDMALETYPLENEALEEIYGSVAQSFSTDDTMNFSEKDVVGIPSASLGGNFKVYVGAKRAISNIDLMLGNAGVAEAAKYFLPMSTADAVLSDGEKESGVALIEMGAGVTSLTIYQNKILRYYFAIPFGGKSITTDIKFECGFTENLAENIKLAFGACMPEKLQNMSEKVLQINDYDAGTPRILPVKYLSEIITARTEEIIDAILFKIQESGYADNLRSGIVLSGGCANMINCSNLIKQMSGYNVRIGYPRTKKLSSSGCPGINETGAAASVGMLLLAAADTHIDCASEKQQRNTTAKQGKTVEKPEKTEKKGKAVKAGGQMEIFGPDEIEIVEPPKKEKTPKKKNNFITWTKNRLNEFMGDLYDGMDE